MNPDEELQYIRNEQSELHKQLRKLDSRIRQLGYQIEDEKESQVPVPQSPLVEKKAPEVIPPVIPPIPEPAKWVREEELVPESALAAAKISAKEESAEFTMPKEPAKEPMESGDLEMKLGSYWFVRVGVTMLLTGFVFLANYAREQFFNLLPAGGKVAVLYALSGLLLGLGLWLERRREELKSYARVLSAGGIAAVYYTTYAAHKVEMLRVIESPVIAGILLLIWAGVLLYVSHKRDSQSLAMTSVFFAYVTCVIIDRATVFTLFSALVLTLVGVFLLLKSRWLKVSIVSLVGTYLTFAYWRFPMLVEWINSRPPDSQNFLLTYTFLIAYWVLFSFAVFASKRESLPDNQRLAFAVGNNAAFVLLFSLGMLRHHPDDFGLFLMIVGVVLTCLHVLAKRRMPEQRILGDSYLITGVLTLTLGVIMHFSGYSLALTLAAESTALLLVARRTKHEFLRAMSLVAAFLSTAFVFICALQTGIRLLGIFPLSEKIHWLAALTASLLLVFNGYVGREKGKFSGQAALYVSFALVVAYFGAIRELGGATYVVVLAVAAIACSCTKHFLRFRELACLGQAFAVLAAARYTFLDTSQPVWVGLVVVPALVYLAYWWRAAEEEDIGMRKADMSLLRDGFSLFGVLSFGLWIHEWMADHDHWLWLGGLLAIGVFVIGMRTRMRALALAGLGFHYAAAVTFVVELNNVGGALLLVPIVLIAGTPTITSHFLKDAERPLSGWAYAIKWLEPLFRVALVILSVLWILEFVDGDFQPLVFGLVAIATIAVSVFLDEPMQRITAMAFLVVGVCIWSVDVFARPPYGWANGLFCFVPLAMQVLVSREGKTSQLTPWLAGATCIMIWRYVSGLVADGFGGFYLTVSWAIIALFLFGLGFLLRERTYRWAGLGILGVSIFRLGFDVWLLDPVPRIFSFIALGLVLVGLGFVYNRWQDTIRKFL